MVRCEKVHDYLQRQREQGEVVVLVDRVWPRGIRKDDLDYDEWAQELAPSSELRRWFAHDPERWPEFQDRYYRELSSFQHDRKRLREIAARTTLTLLFSTRDRDRNQAVVLKHWIENAASEIDAGIDGQQLDS